MSDWNMGYNTDILYTTNYFSELNPLHVRFSFLCQGYDFPTIDKNMTCCELGFGMGLSLLIHSAAGPARWAGTDFAPSQALYAQHMAKDAGLNTFICDDAFDQFLAREDLPQFDFIALHGIWSWIAPMFQEQILEFIKKRLKVGGVVYISYNNTPGFLALEPARHLMHEYAEFLGLGVERVKQMEIIKDFFKRLEQVAPLYYEYSPSMIKRMQDLFAQDEHYLIHEYFNDIWEVENRSDMVAKMRQAQLTYITQPFAVEIQKKSIFTPKQEALFEKVNGTPVEQPLYDMLLNTQFTRDYYCRGPRRLNITEQIEKLEQSYFISVRGEVHLGEKMGTKYSSDVVFEDESQVALLNFLKDFKPHSYKEIKQAFSGEPLGQDAFLNVALMVSANFGLILPVMPPHQVSRECKEQCAKLNNLIFDNKYDNRVNFLASPIAQGGFMLPSQMMVMLSLYNREKVRNESDLIKRLKQGLSNKTIVTYDQLDSEQQDQEVRKTVREFMRLLPLYKSFGLC